MKVTVNFGSARPGGIDVAFAGLAAQTYPDWELVFVDALYHRRHRRVLAAWAEACEKTGCQAKLFHVPNHRYRPDLWGTTCAGYNTGFALADSEIVILLLDYAYAPPGWIEAHVRYHDSPRIVMGPYLSKQTPIPIDMNGRPGQFLGNRTGTPPEALIGILENYDMISVFRELPKDFANLADSAYEGRDPKTHRGDAGPHTYLDFHTKNESFPRENIFRCNGMDERYDEICGPGDAELGFRLSTSGLECFFNPEARVYVLNPRQYMPNPNGCLFHDKRAPPPHHARAPYVEGEAIFQDVMAQREIRAKNPQSLEELRDRIWHWRADSQEQRAVLPKTTLSDEDYYLP